MPFLPALQQLLTDRLGCSPEDQMYYELTGPDGNLVECSNTPETPDGTVYTTTW